MLRLKASACLWTEIIFVLGTDGDLSHQNLQCLCLCAHYKEYMKFVYCNGELYEAEALGKHLFPVVCENGWGDVPGATPVIEVLKVFLLYFNCF